MNCFNIRELQGILKRRFFTDLVNTSDFRTLLDESMVGLRFKTGNQNTIHPNSVLFYNYGITTDQGTKSVLFNNQQGFGNAKTLNTPLLVVDGFLYQLTSFFNDNGRAPFNVNSTVIFTNISALIKDGASFFSVALYFSALTSLKNLTNSLINTLLTNLNLNLSTSYFRSLLELNSTLQNNKHVENFSSGLVVEGSQVDNSSYYSESSNFRFTRFNNALIQYDYKCGNYIGAWEKLYPTLINSFIEVARGVRKPSWLFAEDVTSLLNSNFTNFTTRFVPNTKLELSEANDWFNSHVTPMDNFFSVFNSYNTSSVKVLRWVSVNSLNQKFQHMFFGASTQQRVLANWKQLKFTREA